MASHQSLKLLEEEVKGQVQAIRQAHRVEDKLRGSTGLSAEQDAAN